MFYDLSSPVIYVLSYLVFLYLLKIHHREAFKGDLFNHFKYKFWIFFPTTLFSMVTHRASEVLQKQDVPTITVMGVYGVAMFLSAVIFLFLTRKFFPDLSHFKTNLVKSGHYLQSIFRNPSYRRFMVYYNFRFTPLAVCILGPLYFLVFFSSFIFYILSI